MIKINKNHMNDKNIILLLYYNENRIYCWER